MGLIFDATVLIDFERGRIDLASRIADRGDEHFYISVITASEILHGVHRARTERARARRRELVDGLLDRFPVLPIDLATARTHARLWADLVAGGLPVGAHDLWLASACVTHGHTLATANVRDFARIRELRMEQW